MIKVLHISKALGWRGGERQVCNLLGILKTSKFSSNYLLCDEKSKLNERFLESTKICHNGNIVSWVKKIKKICIEYNIDIIHVHESKSHTLAVLQSLFYNNKRPIIVTRRVLFPIKGVLSIFKYKYVDKIICISKPIKDKLSSLVEKSKLIVIHSAIDIDKYNENKNTRFSFLDNDKIKISYVAALTKEKDHITFLLTAKEILKSRKDIIFYLIGDGILKREISEEIVKMKLTPHVKLIGFIKNIDELIPNLDLLLFTSKLEGLGSSVLDFFLAKKPVVATNSIGVSSLISDNETGFLSPLGDYKSLAEKVLCVLEDKALEKKITDKAFEKVKEDFNLAKTGKNYEDLYLSYVK